MNMKTRAAAGFIATGALLASCASPPPGRTASAPPCKAADCVMDVHVGDDCAITPGETDAWTIEATGSRLVWHLDDVSAAKYKFPDDGVAFKGDTKNQFHGGRPVHDRREFQWIDAHDASGTFTYRIRVVTHDESGACVQPDPFIINN